MVFYGVIGAEIRACFRFIMENHGAKKQDIARKYNISRASLYRILNNENWDLKKNVSGEDIQRKGVLENLVNTTSGCYCDKSMPLEDKRVPLL